jgi:hypothetical protein
MFVHQQYVVGWTLAANQPTLPDRWPRADNLRVIFFFCFFFFFSLGLSRWGMPNNQQLGARPSGLSSAGEFSCGPQVPLFLSPGSLHAVSFLSHAYENECTRVNEIASPRIVIFSLSLFFFFHVQTSTVRLAVHDIFGQSPTTGNTTTPLTTI